MITTGASNPALGIRYVLIAMGMFALQDASSKYLAGMYPPQFFIMIRFWIFALFVIFLVSRRPGGIRAAAHSKMPKLQVFRGVLLASQIVVIVISFHNLGLAETQAIFSIHPLIATLIAVPLLGERIGLHRGLAIVAGFFGVMLIMHPGPEMFRPAALIALFVACMMAVYTITTRMVSRADRSSIPAVFWLAVAGAGALTLVGPFYAVPMAPVDIGWLLFHTAVSTAGHYSLIRALEATEAVRIQPFTYLQMVLAIPIGAFVFGEHVAPLVILGMAITVGAGLYAIWREYRLSRAARVAAAAEPGS